MSAAPSPTPSPPPLPEQWNLPSRGRIGMALLILTETAFFSIFVAAYIFYIGKSLNGPYPDQVLRIPILNTVCLLSSSITIMLALRALRAQQTGAFALWWLVTLALGCEFIAGTALEWLHLIYVDGLTIHTNLFGTTFYSLVGLHAFHVTVGLILLSIVMVLTLTGRVRPRHHERIELLSWYWHFVDCVWVVVFLTVYIVGR